jgi:hypothetical protein
MGASFATPYIVITHYTDLAHSDGVVLLRTSNEFLMCIISVLNNNTSFYKFSVDLRFQVVK